MTSPPAPPHPRSALDISQRHHKTRWHRQRNALTTQANEANQRNAYRKKQKSARTERKPHRNAAERHSSIHRRLPATPRRQEAWRIDFTNDADSRLGASRSIDHEINSRRPRLTIYSPERHGRSSGDRLSSPPPPQKKNRNRPSLQCDSRCHRLLQTAPFSSCLATRINTHGQRKYADRCSSSSNNNIRQMIKKRLGREPLDEASPGFVGTQRNNN